MSTDPLVTLNVQYGRDDVLAAAQWALDSDHLFDRTRLAFVGASAGGNLAVEAGIATGRPAVSWSGMFDLLSIVQSTDTTVTAEPTTQDLRRQHTAADPWHPPRRGLHRDRHRAHTRVSRIRARNGSHVTAESFGSVGNVFYFVASGTVAHWTVPDANAVVAEWTAHGAKAHRGPKTVFTGERLCQLLDPFGNLFAVREEPTSTSESSTGEAELLTPAEPLPGHDDAVVARADRPRASSR